jgi:hypothetical protein
MKDTTIVGRMMLLKRTTSGAKAERGKERMMDKLISQQAAIDALCKSECGWNNAECRHKDGTDFCVTCDNVKIIKSLPSAQPAQSEMIKEIRRWINSGNRGNADYFIVDRIEEIINAYEIN